MQVWLLVGAGGFLGAVMRYGLSGWIQGGGVVFPSGTLGVNVIGSFLLGLFMFLSGYGGLFSEEMRLFFAIGVLGAFTTMSTFSYESLCLLSDGEDLLFWANIAGTLLLTIGAVYAGRACAVALSGGVQA